MEGRGLEARRPVVLGSREFGVEMILTRTRSLCLTLLIERWTQGEASAEGQTGSGVLLLPHFAWTSIWGAGCPLSPLPLRNYFSNLDVDPLLLPVM